MFCTFKSCTSMWLPLLNCGFHGSKSSISIVPSCYSFSWILMIMRMSTSNDVNITSFNLYQEFTELSFFLVRDWFHKQVHHLLVNFFLSESHIFHLFEFSLNWSWVVKLGHKALTLDWIWGKKICISMFRNVPDICSRNMLFHPVFMPGKHHAMSYSWI